MKATEKQYRTAITNYRSMAARHRQLSKTHPVGSWRIAADLRVAEKADMDADQLERKLVDMLTSPAKVAA